MERMEAIRVLELFGIPAGADAAARDIREMLARLIRAESLRLGEAQTARDIVSRVPGGVDPCGYLFLAAMFLSQREGSTFLRPEKGVPLLRRGGILEAPEPGEPSNEAYALAAEKLWSRAIRAAEAFAGDAVTEDGGRWFFQKNFHAVRAVSEALRRLAAEKPERVPSAEALARACAFRGFRLNAAQLRAVQAAAERRFAVITGGPGTGKTTIVCALLRALIGPDLAPEEIALTAPTGRAAQRMGEALREQCAAAEGLEEELRERIGSLTGTTIHTLLGGFAPNWKHHAGNPLGCKLVVVDESSMVDVRLMRALVEALPPGCRLVLLGDRDQLPSVEAGAVLGDVVGGGGDMTVQLTESNRFRGDLAACAAAVNAGDAEAFAAHAIPLPAGEGAWTAILDDPAAENRCFSYELAAAARPAFAQERLTQWAAACGVLAEGELARLCADPALADDPALTEGVLTDRARAIFRVLNRARILTVVRGGPFGAAGVNALLLRKRRGGAAFGAWPPGVPVIVTRNTPSRNLWNGDIGVIVRGASGPMAIFPRGDRVVRCPAALLPEHEPAYAVTVHKSQGSEFDNVLLLLPPDETSPLLTRALLYTGVTRARRRAVVMGTRPAFRRALATPLDRDSGIAL